MKDGKATGPDELPAEALTALDEHNIEVITYGSVGVETPVPVRSPKLSNVEPG